jgi:uncharacterized protein YbjT (DUF2867 family)
MPVIVVGADTPDGQEIVEALLSPGREVRVFVSDPDIGAGMKKRGAKVATGDVSDASHIEAAATRCFSAVLVTEAARDNRERSFIDNEPKLLEAWASAVAGVTRVIWVHPGEPPPVRPSEVVVVEPGTPGLAGRVAELDDARSI